MDKPKGNWVIGPWTCAGITVFAMTLGMMVDGWADSFAALMLLVPSAVVFRHLRRTAR